MAMDKSEYSEDPYEDGTVPGDADMVTSSDDEAPAETPDESAPEPHDEASAEVHPS